MMFVSLVLSVNLLEARAACIDSGTDSIEDSIVIAHDAVMESDRRVCA